MLDRDMELFTIDRTSQYVVVATLVESLEDVTEDVYTREELREIVGRDSENITWWFLTPGKPLPITSAIVSALADLRDNAIRQNKASFVIKDSDLVDALKAQQSDYSIPISRFVPNTRRAGNRVIIMPEKKKDVTRVKNEDFNMLLNVVTRAYRTRESFDVAITHAHENRIGAINLCKLMVKWEEVEAFYTRWFVQMTLDNTQRLARMKMLWDKPELSSQIGAKNKA